MTVHTIMEWVGKNYDMPWYSNSMRSYGTVSSGDVACGNVIGCPWEPAVINHTWCGCTVVLCCFVLWCGGPEDRGVQSSQQSKQWRWASRPLWGCPLCCLQRKQIRGEGSRFVFSPFSRSLFIMRNINVLGCCMGPPPPLTTNTQLTDLIIR